MAKLEKTLERIARCRVLVVGDLMLDEYQRGHVERISPEAPVPILTIVGGDTTLGGAGNVVRNLRSLGAEVQVVGAVGEDRTGDEILTHLQALNADVTGVVRDLGRASTRKVRYVSVEHGQQVFRADEESTHPVTGEVEMEIVRRLCEKVGEPESARPQVILCSDYLKGVLSEGVLQAAFTAGREGKIQTVVAPKDTKARKYAGATVLMPNLKELGKLAGTPVPQDAGRAEREAWLAGSVRDLSRRLGLEALLVTRGSEGMSLFEAPESPLDDRLRRVDIPTVARNVFDVTGAGDTAIAVFAAVLALGAAREDAARLANVAAGIVVGKHGTAAITVEELRERLLEQEPAITQSAAV